MQFLVLRLRALLLLLLPLAAFAQASGDAGFDAALAHFNRARQGESAEVGQAIVAFQAVPANPALQPLYSAYLGSAQTLQGKAAWMPWNKLKFVEQGLDSIDQGLSALRPEHDRQLVHGVPLGLSTKLVAAATFVALPDGLFHRRLAGKSLLAEIRRSPLLPATPAGFRAELAGVEARLQEVEK